METRIESFQGQYRWLSNFWPAEVEFEGITFPTVEHAYQAAKTQDERERRAIAALPTPGQAKRMGKKVRLRSDWEDVKVEVMTQLVRAKFEDPDLMYKLAQTKDAYLIEGNTWGDTFWGVCRGKGKNHLGQILMKVRSEITEP